MLIFGWVSRRVNCDFSRRCKMPDLQKYLKILTDRGLTPTQIATAVGVSAQSVWRWQNGASSTKIAVKRLKAYCEGLTSVTDIDSLKRRLTIEDIDFLKRMLEEFDPLTIELSVQLLVHRKQCPVAGQK